MKEDQNNSAGPDEPSTMGEDTAKIKILEEIESLVNIPGIQEYFFRAILEARHIFHDKIKDYELQKVKNESYKKEAGEVSEISNASKKSMTYFFELNRGEDSQDEAGSGWDLDKCKLPPDAKEIKMVLNDFKKKVEEYEIAPHRIQDEPFQLHPDKWFNIRFTKSSPTRVVGFVKEAEDAGEKAREKQKKEAEGKFILKRYGNMRKLATRESRPLEHEEFQEFLQANKEFAEDVYFSINMKRASELGPEIPS
jgi:hypothetical protein